MDFYEESDPENRQHTSSTRFIAENDGKVLGSLELYQEADGSWVIGEVQVDKEHRRQGIATKLLATAKAELGTVKHSDYLSKDGQAWRKSVEAKPFLSPIDEDRSDWLGKKRFGFGKKDLDPLTPFYAHWDKLSDKAREVVISNAPEISQELAKLGDWGPTHCDAACNLWYQVFQKAGIQSEIRSGNYNPDHDENIDHPLSTDHVWLMVENTLFDPTAGQFIDEEHPQIKENHYYEL